MSTLLSLNQSIQHTQDEQGPMSMSMSLYRYLYARKCHLNHHHDVNHLTSVPFFCHFSFPVSLFLISQITTLPLLPVAAGIEITITTGNDATESCLSARRSFSAY